MWSKARCLAAIEAGCPTPSRVEVGFKKPILLPGTVAFGYSPTEVGLEFALSNPKSGAPHLLGRTTAL